MPKQNLVKNYLPCFHRDEKGDEEGSFFTFFSPPEVVTRHLRESDDWKKRGIELLYCFDFGFAIKNRVSDLCSHMDIFILHGKKVLSRATDYFIEDTDDYGTDDDSNTGEWFGPEEETSSEIMKKVMTLTSTGTSQMNIF